MNKFFIFLISSIIALGLASSSPVSGVTIKNPLSSNTILELLDKIAKTVATIIGSLSTIMLIVAGIMYLTSAGSPEKIGAAKKALIYAIVGMVVAVIAGTIVSIVKEVLGVK
ncbi:MAG: TrbC/VirB2 family protein [Patescibacteria group bacterium]